MPKFYKRLQLFPFSFSGIRGTFPATLMPITDKSAFICAKIITSNIVLKPEIK